MERSPKDEIQPADYQRCLITYLDVLGMRQLLSRSTNSAATRAHIRSLLSILMRETLSGRKGSVDQVFDPHGEHDRPLPVVRTFSDLVVRAVPIALDAELSPELWFLCEIQASLFAQGVLIRGGVTIGDLFWDEQLLFGPGLVRAYELESKLAVYPRIVLDDCVLKRYAQEDEDCSYTLSGSDEVQFIDYLNRGILALIGLDELEFFTRAKQTIEQGLKDFQQLDSIRVKYTWLANYFDDAIRMRNLFFKRRVKLKVVSRFPG